MTHRSLWKGHRPSLMNSFAPFCRSRLLILKKNLLAVLASKKLKDRLFIVSKPMAIVNIIFANWYTYSLKYLTSVQLDFPSICFLWFCCGIDVGIAAISTCFLWDYCAFAQRCCCILNAVFIKSYLKLHKPFSRRFLRR